MKVKLFSILALLFFGVTQGVEAQTHVSKLKMRTVDAEKWTINPNPAGVGETVTATYAGRKKVMSVQAEKNPYTDLSMVDCAGNERQSQWTANCYMVHTAGKYRLPLVYGNAIKNGEANTAAYTGNDYSYSSQYFYNHQYRVIDAPWITKSPNEKGANRGMGISVTDAELLWQDAQGLVTEVGIKGDYLTLTVGKNAAEQEGNAVVAAKDANGTIVWSWHIWVTRQTFAAADLATINTGQHTYTLTPVNLGWVGDVMSRGYCTYYQWGRKDAFSPANFNNITTEGGETIGGGGGGGMGNEGWQTGTTTYAGDLTVYDINNVTIQNPVTVCHDEYSSSTTIATNIKNPTTMYWCDKYTSGNITSVVTTPNKELYINMWNAQQPVTRNSGIYINSNIAEATVKTVYDPCPPGFCVPTDNLYEYIADIDPVSFSFSEDFVGLQLTTATPNVFFPCVGRRAHDTGRVTSVNSSGLFSATAVAPNDYSRHGYTRSAIFFSFGKTTTGRTRTNFSLGYPVRAVAEE